MSVTNTSAVFGVPLAQAVSGSVGQQKAALQASAQSEAAATADELVLSELTAKALGDIGDLDGAGDRDGDGRMPWQVPERAKEATEEREPAPGEPKGQGEEEPPRLDLYG